MCIQGSSHSWLKKKDGSPFSTFQRPIIQSSWMARLAVTPYVTYTLPQHIFAPTGAPPAWKDPGGGGSGHVHFAMLTAQYKKQQLYGVMKTANCKPQSTYQMPLAEILKYQASYKRFPQVVTNHPFWITLIRFHCSASGLKWRSWARHLMG